MHTYMCVYIHTKREKERCDTEQSTKQFLTLTQDHNF